MYADVIKEKADAGSNLTEYPATRLGEQLAIIAGLISGGLETPVYLATMKGFDTHANQLSRQAVLLDELAAAVAAFQRDLTLAGLTEKVVILTISEFGRRLTENASAGTDHGAAAPMFLIGKNVNAGKFGNNPNLTDLDNKGDIKHTYDSRQVYASILAQHFKTESAAINRILRGEFATLPLISGGPTSVATTSLPEKFALGQNYPNPFNATTTIPYEIARSAHAQMMLYDLRGRLVRRMVNRHRGPGRYSATLDASQLASGVYFYVLRAGGFVQEKRMFLVK